MMKQNRSPGQVLFSIFNYAALILFSVTTVYMFVYFIVLSLNDGNDAMKGGVYLWPRMFTMDNYIRAFENPYILNSFLISIFRTVVGTGISLVLTSALAYALTKRGLPGRTAIIFFFFFTTLFSGGLIPYYILLRTMELNKSVWLFVVPYLYVFINTIIMRTFFDTIPASLSESAYIDGCNDIQIYWRIYMPLSGPVIATIALFFGVMHWNDWFTGSFFTNNKNLYPAASLLQQVLTEATFESSGGQSLLQVNPLLEARKSGTTPESLRMTFLVITTLPIICVYPFLQKYFVKGVMIGSIKG